MNKLNSKNKKQRLTLRKAKWFTQNQSNGFTIIEVVLVLAIAGLIFLIVFLALPGLQRSRRDTQRKNDVGKVVSQLENYASNHNGSYPSTSGDLTTFGTTYLTGDGYKDPSTQNTYALSFQDNSSASTSPTTSNAATGTIYVGYKAKCDPATNQFTTGGNSVAVLTKLEAGGLYCQGGS